MPVRHKVVLFLAELLHKILQIAQLPTCIYAYHISKLLICLYFFYKIHFLFKNISIPFWNRGQKCINVNYIVY